MLGSSKVTAFVIVSDAQRAKEFYGGTLGLTFVNQDDYAVVFNANGVTMRASIMPGHKPAQYTVLGWEVADIRAAIAGLVQAGVTFEKYPFLTQDEQGVWTSPDGAAKVAWFKDPDGNVLSVTQL